MKVPVIQTSFRAPNCHAHAERFVRSIKEECLNRLIPLGERHFRRVRLTGNQNFTFIPNFTMRPRRMLFTCP
jgi:hypothetical protein